MQGGEFLWWSLEIWSTIGTWFSAIGTVTVAAASLWLAMRDRRPILRIRADRRVLVQDVLGQVYSSAREVARDQGLPGTDAIEIEVTNMGHRGAIINGVYWRVPWLFRKKTLKAALYQTSPANPLTDKGPWRLGDGASARQIHPEQDFKVLNADQWQKLAKGARWPWAATRFMKVGAVTTIGKVVESSVSPELVEFFRELIREAKSQT